MGMAGIVVTLAVSTVLAAYLFYAVIPVPSEIEQRDDVFWVFARQKCLRGLSIAGEFFRFGHRIVLFRRLSGYFHPSSGESVDHSGIKVNITEFDGVQVRVYEPLNKANNGPAMIWLHGGGWVFGSAEGDDALTSEFTRRLGIVVVSVEYRLAPEFPFPIPFEDCVRATVYFMEHAEEMNIDPHRVAITGSSAGGNLAAAVSLKLRDASSNRRPSVQVLLVPCLQAFDFKTPSYQRDADIPVLPSYWMASFWLWYARGVDGHQVSDALVENDHTSIAAKTSEIAQRVDHNLVPRKYIPETYRPSTVDHGNDALWSELKSQFLNPYFAPLMASDLSGLPTTLVMTAERDVLRDDGIMFARRLASANVPVEHQHYDHGHHLLFIDFKYYNLSKSAIDGMVQFLSKRL